MSIFRRLLRPVPASTIAVFAATLVWAASANVALLTGPQPAADLLSILNGLINSNNTAYGPGAGNAPAGGFAASPRNFSVGGLRPLVSTDFTNATPVNTEVYIGEVYVASNVTITGVAVFNGTDVTDNIKVGLANSNGVVVATSASTAGSGTDTYQLVPFTATYAAVGPATYYVLSMYAAGTSRYNAPPLGSFGCSKQTGQVFATGFTTITPPTTFTANLCNVASLY